MRPAGAVAGLALVAVALLLPGCATGPEVIVVAGHDEAGAPVAGALACLGDDDYAVHEVTVTGRASGEVRRLAQASSAAPGPPVGAAVARVALAPVPVDLGDQVVVSAFRHRQIAEADVRAPLDRDGTPGAYLVATADGPTEGLDAAAAGERIEDLCRDVAEWDLGDVAAPIVPGLAVGLGTVVVAGVVGGVVLARRGRRRG